MALRHRLVKPAVYLGMILALCLSGWGVYRDTLLERRVEAWTVQAQARNLMLTRQLLLPVPNWQYSPLRFLMGRRQIAVAVYTTDDAENLLALPPCPVKLLVETLASTPRETIAQLRDKFGAEYVE